MGFDRRYDRRYQECSYLFEAMASGNPYHDWLALPVELESPNHYQLLQLNPAECTRDAVVSAAKSQLARLRAAAATSANRDDLKRLAKQIESAANCLASAKSREKYNQQLLAALTTEVSSSPPSRNSQASQPTDRLNSSALEPRIVEPVDEPLPVAIPIDDPSEGAPISPTADLFSWAPTAGPPGAPSHAIAEQTQLRNEPTVVAVADPGLHRRRRRVTPWKAYAGIVVALVLLGGAVILAIQPQLIDRWLGRAPVVADSDAANAAPAENSAIGARLSPLDQAAASADSLADDSASAADSEAAEPAGNPTDLTMAPEDSAPDEPAASPPPAGEQLDSKPPTPSAESPENASPTETVSPADDLPSAVDPPARPALSPATVELLLSAALYSLAIGNFDESIEIFSRVDTAQLSPELADRADRLAFVADAHQRFEEHVQRVCNTIAGGETLEMPGNRSIGIVEASGELVVFRAAGTNRRYPPKLLPTEIGLAFAKRAGVNPSELVTMEATESVLQEVRRTIRGRPGDYEQLLAAFSKWQTDSNAQADLGLLEEFVRLDLKPLLIPRQDKSFWAQTSSEPQTWLDPLPPLGDADYPFQALAQSLDQSDPSGRSILYRQAVSEWFSRQQEAVGLAIAATMGQLGDSAGRAPLLTQINLDRISRERAIRLIHILLDRIAHEDDDGRRTLIRICQQIVDKFGLENYGYILSQIDSEEN